MNVFRAVVMVSMLRPVRNCRFLLLPLLIIIIIIIIIIYCYYYSSISTLPVWLGSRVVSVLDSGAEGPRFKSKSTLSGKS